MSEPEEPLNLDPLTALEAALAALVPRADRLDRDRLMFLAGQASRDTRHARWPWPAAFAAMTAVAAGLLVALVIESRPQTARTIPVPPDSVTAGADRQPATPPGRAGPIQPGPEDERPGTPPWAPDGLVLSPADRRLERMALAESPGAAAGSDVPGAARGPASYRELLESLLKDVSSDNL
jgi:hypothetical protein